jgi:hypothetical protein
MDRHTSRGTSVADNWSPGHALAVVELIEDLHAL